MGSEISTKMTEHMVKTSWGGNDRGVCMQITAREPIHLRETALEQLQEEGFINLTMEEASALCSDLAVFINQEAKRRQALLRDDLLQLKHAEKTIFHEVAELSEDLMAVPTLTVELVSRYCPKVRQE